MDISEINDRVRRLMGIEAAKVSRPDYSYHTEDGRLDWEKVRAGTASVGCIKECLVDLHDRLSALEDKQ